MKLLVDDMIDGLLPFYIKAYYAQPEYSIEKFRIITNTVCFYILNLLYCRFVREGDIEPIEKLHSNIKLDYWDISGDFFQEKEKRIKACKAMYTLQLITSTY